MFAEHAGAATVDAVRGTRVHCARGHPRRCARIANSTTAAPILLCLCASLRPSARNRFLRLPLHCSSYPAAPFPPFFLFRGAVGHGRMADFWALGILIHELSCGRTPYYSDDPLDGMRRILLNERKMLAQVARARPALASPRPAAPFRPNADAGRMSHSLMSSQDASRDLVEALLQIEPHRRLGYNGAAPLSAARTPPPRQGGGHPTPCWHTSPCFLVSLFLKYPAAEQYAACLLVTPRALLHVQPAAAVQPRWPRCNRSRSTPGSKTWFAPPRPALHRAPQLYSVLVCSRTARWAGARSHQKIVKLRLLKAQTLCCAVLLELG